MSTTVSVPKEGRICVPVINGSTAATILSGSVVRLATSTAPNAFKVVKMGATAGTVVRVFGVVEHAIATGGIGYCVIHGPAVALAGAVFAPKNPLTALGGTSAACGRAIVATAGTAGVASTGAYLGWAMGPGSTGAFAPVFVNTAHTPVAA